MSIVVYEDKQLQWSDLVLISTSIIASNLITRTREERLLWFVSVVDQFIKLSTFTIRRKYIR